MTRKSHSSAIGKATATAIGKVCRISFNFVLGKGVLGAKINV